jgi:hypothetical protein
MEKIDATNFNYPSLRQKYIQDYPNAIQAAKTALAAESKKNESG